MFSFQSSAEVRGAVRQGHVTKRVRRALRAGALTGRPGAADALRTACELQHHVHPLEHVP
jgi:hypothetical protein